MKIKQRFPLCAAFGALYVLTCCGLAQPAFGNELDPPLELATSIGFSNFIQTIATALFASCVVGVWRMSSQLSAMNARLTNAVTYIDQRLNDQHQRLLYQERKKV